MRTNGRKWHMSPVGVKSLVSLVTATASTPPIRIMRPHASAVCATTRRGGCLHHFEARASTVVRRYPPVFEWGAVQREHTTKENDETEDADHPRRGCRSDARRLR